MNSMPSAAAVHARTVAWAAGATTVLGAASGALVAADAVAGLGPFGSEKFAGDLVGLAATRTLAPHIAFVALVASATAVLLSAVAPDRPPRLGWALAIALVPLYLLACAASVGGGAGFLLARDLDLGRLLTVAGSGDFAFGVTAALLRGLLLGASWPLVAPRLTASSGSKTSKVVLTAVGAGAVSFLVGAVALPLLQCLPHPELLGFSWP